MNKLKSQASARWLRISKKEGFLSFVVSLLLHGAVVYSNDPPINPPYDKSMGTEDPCVYSNPLPNRTCVFWNPLQFKWYFLNSFLFWSFTVVTIHEKLIYDNKFWCSWWCKTISKQSIKWWIDTPKNTALFMIIFYTQ